MNVRSVLCAMAVVAHAILAGCASTRVALSPSPQASLCDRTATALVLWAPQRRADQKDVQVAAETGLRSFFESSGCFARSELRRAPSLERLSASALVRAEGAQVDRVVIIGVRELGPVIRLLSSVEGETEVVLYIEAHSLPRVDQPREFTVHWQHGGPGVIKGVASLAGNMESALRAGLQPSGSAR